MPNKRLIPFIISVFLLLILLFFIHQQVNEISLKTEKLGEEKLFTCKVLKFILKKLTLF